MRWRFPGKVIEIHAEGSEEIEEDGVSVASPAYVPTIYGEKNRMKLRIIL